MNRLAVLHLKAKPVVHPIGYFQVKRGEAGRYPILFFPRLFSRIRLTEELRALQTGD